jgi:hypothetical protein
MARMPKTKRFRLIPIAAAILLGGAFLVARVLTLQPDEVDIESALGQEIKASLIHFDQLRQLLSCKPDTNVNVLAEILIDSADYQPNPHESAAIQRFFGLDGLNHAGYLTSQQAYYRSWRSPATSTPPPDNRPTPHPTRPPAIYHCPDSPPESHLTLKSIVLYPEGCLTAQYDDGCSLYEATLRSVNDRWMISGMKLIFGCRG